MFKPNMINSGLVMDIGSETFVYKIIMLIFI